jgi:hypothetical protein
VQNLISTCGAVPADYHLVAGDITDLNNAANPWLTAFDARVAGEATLAGLVMNENTTYDACIAVLRAKYLKVLGSPPVSDAKKAAAGFPVLDTNPTPAAVPTSAPVVSMASVIGAGELRIDFRDQLTPNTKAKPAGVREAEIWSKVDGTAPADGSGCAYMGSDGATPYLAVFDVAQAGKPVWFCLRWKNTRGRTGPWGPVFATMVPGTGGGS